MGQIVFYEGNGGSQDIVHTTDDAPGQDFRPRQNDEARSVKQYGRGKHHMAQEDVRVPQTSW